MMELMELELEGVSVLGTMKVLEAFGNRITDIRAEHNPINEKLEVNITLGGVEELAIIPEENRIVIVDCEELKEVILYRHQFQRFIIQ